MPDADDQQRKKQKTIVFLKNDVDYKLYDAGVCFWYISLLPTLAQSLAYRGTDLVCVRRRVTAT